MPQCVTQSTEVEMEKMKKKYCWELVLNAIRENHQLLSKADLNAAQSTTAVQQGLLQQHAATKLSTEHFSSYESANPSLCFFETSQELDVDDYCHRCLETTRKKENYDYFHSAF